MHHLPKVLFSSMLIFLSLNAFSQDSVKINSDTLILNGFVLDRNDFDEIHILKANSGLQYFMQLQPGLKTILNPSTEIINGSSLFDNTFYIEGLPLRSLFDGYGTCLINERMIDRLSFQTLNYSPEKTGISSVSDISLFYGNRDKLNTFYSQSVLFSDINLNGPLGKSSSFNADFRFMPLGLLPVLLASPVPMIRYRYNVNFALESRINRNNSIRVFFGNNPYGVLMEQTSATADMGSNNHFYGIRWMHDFSERTHSEILIGKSGLMSGMLVERQDPFRSSRERLTMDDYIADIKLSSERLKYNRLNLGLRMDINHILQQSLISAEGRPDSTYTKQDQVYTDLSLYFSDRFSWRRFSANLGFRTGLYQKEAFQDLYFYPQLNLALQLFNGFSLVGDVSYNTATIQSVQSLDESSFISYSDLLDKKSSLKYQLGFLSAMFSGQITAECLVFYYELDHDIENYRWESEPGPADITAVANSSWSQFYGVNARIRKPAGVFTGWISLSLAENYQQFYGVNDNEPFSPFDFTKGIFSGYTNYNVNDRISVGLSASYCTGNEYSYTEYFLDGGAIGMRAEIPQVLKGGIHFNYRKKKERSVQNFYFALGPQISFRYSLSL